jgi:pimeloyl-ACP methyl ester carboxylesterase
MVAYAYARLFPDQTRGIMVLDVPLPAIEPWPEVQREPALWHFHFHQTPRLPEALIGGREAIYIRDFVDRLGANASLFSDQDVARFAAAYGTACSLRAGFEFYRAFPENTKWNQSNTAPSNVPIVLAGGSRATASFLSTTAGDIRRKGVQLVTVETIADSGHYVADEQPKQVGALIAKYAGR